MSVLHRRQWAKSWPSCMSDNAAAPVGAGAWHGRKWSLEAKNGQACCQQGSLDVRAEAGPTEQNNIMRSHGTFLHFAV